MIVYRTYKYLTKPTAKQKETIKEIFEYCSYVYNRYIEENGFEKYKYLKSKEILNIYKNNNEFLYKTDQSALMNMLFSLQDINRNNKNITKKKKLKSYTTSNLSGKQAIYFIDEKVINVPYLGNLYCVINRQLPENANIFKVTISLDNDNSYYICISLKIDIINSYKRIDVNNSLGLDYSQKYLYIDNEGNRCNMKHYYQEQEERISKLKRALIKCEKNSINFYKIKNKINKLYKRSYNQRNDFLHKESTRLANKYDFICVEDINMKDIASKHHQGKNVYDNGYYKFLQYLKYKMEDRGKRLIVIDKYFPSSKKCHVCGNINNDLVIDDRNWICEKCGTKLDRDINAAINIRNRGIEKFMSIGYLDEAFRKGSIPNSNRDRSADL